MIADESAIGMINGKTTAVRVIPVPGKTVGDVAHFGGLLGEASIIRVPGGDASGFVKLGGRIRRDPQSAQLTAVTAPS